MGIPRSSYYQRQGQTESETPATDVDLRAAIEAICVDLPGYGYRRVTRQLNADGWRVNHKRVAPTGTSWLPAGC
ncbi:MAG: transposase [Caldilineae bacterium]|nr:transposase [Chloroflexota bacterium]MCB9175837.1 transposase [Caldilineae bacterium]